MNTSTKAMNAETDGLDALCERLQRPIGAAMIDGTYFKKGDPLHDSLRLEAAAAIRELRAQLAQAGMPCDAWDSRCTQYAREIERLNKWADGFSDAQLKERRTAEEYQRELRAERDSLRTQLAEARKVLSECSGVIKLLDRDAKYDSVTETLARIDAAREAKEG